MPDDTLTPAAVPETQEQESDFEKLFQEAAKQANTAVNDHPKPCDHPSDDPLRGELSVCPTCLWSFCPECASILDPRYCKLCLREADAELKELPLRDTEGVEHIGRELVPASTATFYQPRFGTLTKTICEMSKSDLENYIDQYKELVRQAEKALDFRRIVLGASQLELAQRQDAERRHLRADRKRYPVKTITLDKSTGKQKVATASMTKMLEMLRALEALKKAKS